MNSEIAVSGFAVLFLNTILLNLNSRNNKPLKILLLHDMIIAGNDWITQEFQTTPLKGNNRPMGQTADVLLCAMRTIPDRESRAVPPAPELVLRHGSAQPTMRGRAATARGYCCW